MVDCYSIYLPHINVNDGKSRVMGNLALYIKLLKRFDGRKMVNQLIDSILEGDVDKIIQQAHALRGAASNLSLPMLHSIVDRIEERASRGQDAIDFADQLEEAANELEKTIENFFADTKVTDI